MPGKTDKTPGPAKGGDAPGRTYFVRLELEDADHRRLRIRAAEDGVPMATFVKRVVLGELDARDKA